MCNMLDILKGLVYLDLTQLPEDAQITGVHYDYRCDAFEIRIHSSHFELVPEATVIPDSSIRMMATRPASTPDDLNVDDIISQLSRVTKRD